MQKVKKTVNIETTRLSASDCEEIFVATFSAKASFGVNSEVGSRETQRPSGWRYAGARNQVPTSFSEIAQASESRALGSPARSATCVVTSRPAAV